ncbi:fumarylacetoacetate hydrolase family protein [Cohnella nanjingensis]|uniref:Fumarylacetoacetate hydrolase family protein n=1 Tax=Cohnella nanjingensis TaxID=1387779 RepID=A0A7X0RNH8_9BACL|nr:fumarylacetoacetate hydrolase family protein [Cohnella nanjingensis]MBB6670782.1 fumarylacetoacetate hydrolase family protein [Cohnella nanjingensis]
MQLINFKWRNEFALGIRTEEGIAVVSELAAAAGASGVPVTMSEALRKGGEAIDAVRRLWEATPKHRVAYVPEDGILYGPCNPQPGKIVCVGLNYRRHAEETNSPIPEYPVLFSKFENTIAAHDEDVPLPQSHMVDYEAELAMVIGRTAKDVGEDEALEYVAGYCVADDLSARDLQGRTSQWLVGKSCDRFCPVGPYLVTADEVGDPNRLGISLRVNGEIRQQSNTQDMIFDCKKIVSYVSRYMTLKPGDMILTGTPEGVIVGYPPEKRVWLKSGDTVTVEIEKLGRLTNTLV